MGDQIQVTKSTASDIEIHLYFFLSLSAAEIFWVNQQGALEKQLDPGRWTGIPEAENLLRDKGLHCSRGCHLEINNYIIWNAKKTFLEKLAAKLFIL